MRDPLVVPALTIPDHKEKHFKIQLVPHCLSRP
jgi:hypothetical protein